MVHFFTMVEENFEIWPLEIPQIDRYLLFTVQFMTIVEENLKFGHVKLLILWPSWLIDPKASIPVKKNTTKDIPGDKLC